jgi:hypothetical protein
MPDRFQAKLISGGHKGAEAEFSRVAKRFNVPQVVLSYEGHKLEYDGEVEVLNDAALSLGDVSMEIVFDRLHRRFHRGKGIKRVIQSIFHIVKRGDHLFAVGWIQEDDTVKGGTGWGVELAKFFNRTVSVFDQDKEQWFTWRDNCWQEDEPTIPDQAFSATGTRKLSDGARQAIDDLFKRSFPDA